MPPAANAIPNAIDVTFSVLSEPAIPPQQASLMPFAAVV